MSGFDKFREAWFAEIYQKHFSELYFYLKTYIVNEAEVQDIIHDAFIGLLENGRIERVANIKGYLFSCIRHDLSRRLKNSKKFERLMDEMSRSIVSNDMSESTMAREQMMLMTEAAIQTLPPVCKAIFTMAKQKGMSYRQISAELAISEKTVEAQMGIAFKKIREYVSLATLEEVK